MCANNDRRSFFARFWFVMKKRKSSNEQPRCSLLLFLFFVTNLRGGMLLGNLGQHLTYFWRWIVLFFILNTIFYCFSTLCDVSSFCWKKSLRVISCWTFWRKKMELVTKENVLLEKNRFFIRRRYFVCVSHDLFRLFAQRIDFNILSSHFEFQEKFIDFSVLIYLD